MATVENLESRNKECAKTYIPAHDGDHFAAGKSELPHVMIVSCCDFRLIPEGFGLFSREEYVVVRNAGGRAKRAVRDIIVLSCVCDITDIVLIHHLDCGMTKITDDDIRKILKSRGLGDEKLDTMEFGQILVDLKQSVIDDVAFLKASPYLRKDMRVHGYLFDLLGTGLLVRV